jgi:arylsulfatase A-like enzyme
MRPSESQGVIPFSKSSTHFRLMRWQQHRRMIIALLSVSFVSLVIGARFMQPVRSGHETDLGSERTGQELNQLVQKPNVLIILTDDQPARGTMRIMPKTRRLFKRQGTYFSEAFATTPQCCPSRATIFSGRYAHNHGVRSNNQSTNLDQALSLQKYLRDDGYRTGIFGKFLNAWPLNENPKYFDEWAVPQSRAGYYPTKWNVNGDIQTLRRYATDLVRRFALRFIKNAENDDPRPWFLFLSTKAPHAPYLPEREYKKAAVPPWKPSPAVFETDLRDKPSFVPEWVDRGLFPMNRVRDLRRDQLRTLLSVDNLVGRVFSSLEHLDEDRRTLAIFMSDNGYLWHDHRLAGPRYGKRTPYENAIRIPLFIRWQGQLGAGAIDRRLVANVDIGPTVLDAAGLLSGITTPLDGNSLLTKQRRDHLLIEHWPDSRSKIPHWNAIRTHEYTYVEYYRGDSSEIIFREFYDLGSDPYQLTNLLGDASPRNNPNPRLLNRLSRQIAEDSRCKGTACP